MTYEQLRMECCAEQELSPEPSRSCQPDFRASRTALQEKVSAMVMSAICGERLQDVSDWFVRNGLSVRIRQVYSQEPIKGIFAESSMTYPRWGTVHHGECGELVTSEHLISESVCSLLPTPTASEGFAYTKISKSDVQSCVWRQHHPKERGKMSGHTKRLVEYLAYLGTPLRRIVDLHEMIMGFPKGWTDLDVSETR